MSQTEIKAALLAQEDHIQRVRSCKGETGRAHVWRAFLAPREVDTSEINFERCLVCGVSRHKLPFEYYVRMAGK